jgi:hypothetical protein
VSNPVNIREFLTDQVSPLPETHTRVDQPTQDYDPGVVESPAAISIRDQIQPSLDDSLETAGRIDETIHPGAIPAPDDALEVEDYHEVTVDQLRDEAKQRGLTGYSRLTKDELVAALEADDAAREGAGNATGQADATQAQSGAETAE